MALESLWFKKGDQFYKALVVTELVDYFVDLGGLTTEQKDSAIKNAERQASGHEKEKKDEEKNEVEPAQRQAIDSAKKENESINDPNEGFGKPGSLKFHKNCVHELDDVSHIEKYVQGVTGEKFKKAYKSTGAAKNAAIRLIKDYLKNAGQDS